VSGAVTIGGEPVVSLRAVNVPPDAPAFLSAEVLPGRGMMLLRTGLRLPSGALTEGLVAPSGESAAREFDGGPDDFAGNKSFSLGGALLAPYANRISGRDVAGAREIEARIDGHRLRLPRNWGGKAAGARTYAMHGLILDASVTYSQAQPDRVTGRRAFGDFGGRWPSRTDMDFEWRLEAGALLLSVRVRNTGQEPLPFGLGWHPYFALPSGRRDQARLRLPAASRVEVNNYDEVLPTGRLLPTAGTAYDFSEPGGRALGGLYLDDCFTNLSRENGCAVIEMLDPAAALGLRVSSPTPQVKAVQVFAPADKAFIAVEPQFNLADPYSDVWSDGTDTGMARIAPGASLDYDVRVEAFTLGRT
jgi:galactose mutarotase-like enzyme